MNDSLTMTIDAGSARLISCSPAVSRLLGHASPAACIRMAGRRSPFQGVNLLQVLRAARSGKAAGIPVTDNSCRPVAEVRAACLPDANGHVLVEVQRAGAMILPGGRLDILSTGDLYHGSAELAERLGCGRTLTSLYDVISPDDHDVLESILAHRGLPGAHEVVLRAADTSGQAVELVYRFRWMQDGLSGSIEILPASGAVRLFAVSSLRFSSGIDHASGDIIEIPSGFDPVRFARRLSYAVRESWHESELHVLSAGQYLVFRLPCFEAASDELSGLVTPSRAQFRPHGLQIGQLVRQARAEGMHVAVVLMPEGGLQLSLARWGFHA